MTTRLLCCADLHLGAGAQHRSDALRDQETILEQIVDVARDREVDGVLIAGDVFHRPKPAPPVLHLFGRFARRLEQAAIPAVAVLGDAAHDQSSVDEETALELFGHGDWMRVSRHPEVLRLSDVAVCTLPAVTPSRLAAMLGTRDGTADLAVELLLRTAQELRDSVEGPAVLLAHHAILGAALPNGMPVEGFAKPMLPPQDLEALGFDAIVLGDIHKPQVLGTDPAPFFYCGSPMCHDFGEQNTEHGVWILDIDESGVADASLVELADRRFVTVDVDLTEPGVCEPETMGLDETDVIASAVTLPIDGAVVRVRYKASEEQHRRVDRKAILNFLADAGADRVLGPTWEPVRTARARVQVDGDGLSDADYLRMWCDASGIDGEQAGQLAGLLEHEAAS